MSSIPRRWRKVLPFLPGISLIFTLALCLTGLRAADWPQFLGPTRDGVYAGEDLARQWPPSGPRVLWKRDAGQGFANPIVAGGTLILFHRVDGRDVVDALGADDGRELWTFSYPTDYRDDFGFDEGPRASPAAAGDRVYTFGAQGSLQCLTLSSGSRIWQVDTRSQFRPRKGFFGAACSPLVRGGAVYVHVGANGAGVVAFDADTGRTLWKATDDEAGYSSPVHASIGGVARIISFTRSGVVSLDPATGRVGFRVRWRSRSRASVNAATPLIVGDQIFVSASYSTGALLLDASGESPEEIWTSNDALSNHYATSVYRDGYLYGFHGRQEYGPSLRCVEWRTGRVEWNEDGLGAGTVTLAGDRLLILTERGELILAASNPEGFQVISRAKVLEGTVRAYPALARGRLYVRNEKTLVCIDLGK